MHDVRTRAAAGTPASRNTMAEATNWNYNAMVREPLTLSETTRFASNRNTTFRPTESHDFQIA